MKRYFDKKLMLASVLGVSLMGLVVPTAMARMGGDQPCGNCHTMHNSQDGNDVNDGSALVEGNTLANGSLLIDADCISCHTGANTGTNGTPYVFDTTYGDDLAGGNFAWINTNGEATGHNIVSINGADVALGNTPPGGAALTGALTCAGTLGCHGDRTATTQFAAVSGGHHGLSANGTTMDGTDMANSYRMLDGVQGIEDADWEMSVSATDHNQYYGVDRTDEDTIAGTISALCAGCHGEFHADVTGVDGTLSESFTGNPWIRHPTDFDMTNAGGEYLEYGGVTNAYVPGVPVASNTMANGVLSAVFATADDAIVTCVSCHRVHASEHDDLLRWDYAGMLAHGGNNTSGCFACHTTKDDL